MTDEPPSLTELLPDGVIDDLFFGYRDCTRFECGHCNRSFEKDLARCCTRCT